MNLASATSSRRTALAAAVLATGLLGVLAPAPAAAHSTVISPETRNYGCLQRWGSSEPS